MKSGDIVACEAWSGDVINLLGGGKYKWVPPEEGFAIWTDNMLVPNKAEHKANVEKMMNFYYDPVNAAQARRPGTTTSARSQGAQEEIGAVRQVGGEQPVHLPRRRRRCENGHQFMPLTEKQEQDYQRQFNEVMGG